MVVDEIPRVKYILTSEDAFGRRREREEAYGWEEGGESGASFGEESGEMIYRGQIFPLYFPNRDTLLTIQSNNTWPNAQSTPAGNAPGSAKVGRLDIE
jgi:hypothetical protein